MMMDYSEILSRLVVFLGAGLPVRKAWAKIVEDYRRTEEKAGERAAYEEMAAAYYLMQRGVPEIRHTPSLVTGAGFFLTENWLEYWSRT